MAAAGVDERDYVAIGRQYAEDVIAGRVPACKWVRAACQRQIDDLARTDWEWHFDEARANRFCYFAELLPHVKGRWSSKTVVLEPWQCFDFTVIFGWINVEGFRRFRKALIVIPARNGKSVMGAMVGLYLLALDGEPGPEVYSAATTRDQAKIVWETARQMVLKSEGFRKRYGIEPLMHSIAIESEAASFKPLSRDANSLEGLNASGVIIDEWHASVFTREVLNGLLRIGFLYPQQIIWNKGRTVLTRTHYWYQHEPCWYVRKKNAPWYGKAGENSTIWDSPSPKFIMGGSDEEKFDHPTQKPVELMRRPILNHTKRGELVYEPFLGSGTTLAAAELTERVCCGIELDPKYVDVIVARWQALSGKRAKLQGDGRTFEEIAEERLSASNVSASS
jgi:Phage Terminase/DNA methylase